MVSYPTNQAGIKKKKIFSVMANQSNSNSNGGNSGNGSNKPTLTFVDVATDKNGNTVRTVVILPL